MAHLSEADLEIVAAERDASPERWEKYLTPEGKKFLDGRQKRAGRERIERPPRDSLSSESSVETGHEHSRRPSTFLRTTTTQVENGVFAYLERHPTALQRMAHHRLQHSQTVGSKSGPITEELPDFGAQKPYPPPLPSKEEYVTEFTGHDDPEHPQNWSFKRKLIISGIMIWNSFAATLASAIFSPTVAEIEQDFGVGGEVTVLGTSLFVLGYALGPSKSVVSRKRGSLTSTVIWAPVSELYGRRVPAMIAAFAFGIFLIGVSVSKDIQTLLVSIQCR